MATANDDTSDDAAIREYAGPDIVVTWQSSRCQHAAECVQGLPLVFRPGQRPWIEARLAAVDELVATIDRCPSHALGYRTKDGRTRTAPTH